MNEYDYNKSVGPGDDITINLWNIPEGYDHYPIMICSKYDTILYKLDSDYLCSEIDAYPRDEKNLNAKYDNLERYLRHRGLCMDYIMNRFDRGIVIWDGL